MIEDSHQQLSLVVVVFDYQYFFIPSHTMNISIGSANLGKRILLVLLRLAFSKMGIFDCGLLYAERNIAIHRRSHL
jgi:hypothetical protein